jgi:NAD(P)-dependent dehydrogenase (short-subunit alcohol dehydrogenase family)
MIGPIMQALAEAGADVVIASRKLDACEAAAAEVGRRPGGGARRSPATSAAGTTATG